MYDDFLPLNSICGMAALYTFKKSIAGREITVQTPTRVDRETAWTVCIKPLVPKKKKIDVFCREFDCDSATALSRPCWKLRKQQLPKGCLILKDTKSKLAQTQAWKAGVKKIMQRQRQIELKTAALNYATYPTDAAFERARSTKRKVTVATCPVGSRVHCPSLHRTKQAAIELLQQELGATTYTPSYVVKSRSMSRQEIGSSAYNASEKIHVSNIPPWPDFKSAEHQIQATESCIRKALVMLGVPMFDVEARIRDCTLMCKIGMPGADTVLQVPLFLPLSLSQLS